MNLPLKKLALAIGVSFTTLAASPSYALLISTSVTSSASVKINGESSSDSQSNNTYAFSEAGLWVQDPVKNSGANGASSAYGTADGSSGLKSNGSYYLDRNALSTPLALTSSAQVLHSALITNDSVFGQLIDFNFLILAGNLNLGYSDTYGDSSTLIQSGYSADIRVNGSSLWHSDAQLTAVDDWWNGQTLATHGTVLGATDSISTVYNWENYTGSLNLGYLAAGASLTLEYALNTYVNQYLADEGYAHTPSARFDDPWDFNASPLFDASQFSLTSVDTPASEVAEPAGLLLLGAGLAGLAFRRRARKTAESIA